MARDPPSLISSSELRDLSLTPSQIRNARITIVHPQLRDLILPLERGHVLYPRGNSIEEQKWVVTGGESSGSDDDGAGKSIVNGSSKTFAKLSFTPNCLTARGDMIACGGQHGELYLTNLPSSSKARLLSQRFTTSPPIKPFTLSVTLPTRSINNSLTILPGWPDEWHQKEHSSRSSYVGKGEMILEEGDDEVDENADEDDRYGDGERNQDDADEDEDVLMDIDSEDDDQDEDDEEDDMLFGSPSSSVATYPNTVPFLHAPRIPNLPTSPILDIPTTSRTRRATSFGGSERIRSGSRSSSYRERERPILSSSFDGPSNIQYVTSLPRPRTGFVSESQSRFGTSPSASSVASSIRTSPNANRSVKAAKKRERKDEPRILISNNDQTVKMFSLRPMPRSQPHTQSRGTYRDRDIDREREREREQERISSSSTDPLRRHAPRSQAEARALHERARRIIESTGRPIPPAPPHFGSSYGWDAVDMNEGIRSNVEDGSMQREIQRVRDVIRTEQDTLRRQRDDFERVVGMRVGVGSTGVFGLGETGSDGSPSPTPPVGKDREERRLSKVGGSRFKYAINHSSLSPDMKTMVSVGDSTDVYLFEVIDGGREFKRIGTYNAATDSGFSTSWSKDGRKFAVASQDGQVTVWDHRSSRPLAIFHTSATAHPPSSPSFTSDLASSRHSPIRQRYASPSSGPEVILIDPVTGDSHAGSSTSGREAARVVKFSPEGSSRDLMVFTEENSHIHLVDARTFHTHVIVPVPYIAPSTTVDPAAIYRERTGVEGGTWGVAGAAFDPTGDWLYSGTEKTVVEWDLRRLGGGETGTWSMA